MSNASRIEQKAEQAEHKARNAAQRARGARGDDRKKLRDSANVLGGETWENTAGHSGTPTGYIASGIIVAGFIVGGVGLTAGPRVLVWIGVAIVVLTGIFGMATHVWSDYEFEKPAPDHDESGSSLDDAHS